MKVRRIVDGVVAETITTPQVFSAVRDFGAEVGTNATASIQAALDAAASDGFAVHVPAGTYNVDALSVPSGVRLFGDGRKTKLLLRNSQNSPVIELDTASTEMVQIHDLWVDGNRANQSSGQPAISLSNSGGSFTFADPAHTIERVLVTSSKGAGLSFGTDVRACHLSAVDVRNCDGHGFLFTANATDNVLTSCIAASCGGSGFRFAGANQRAVGCKGSYNTSHGFHIVASRTTLSGCEGQDNDGSGFVLGDGSTTVEHCSVVGVIADSNVDTGVFVNGAAVGFNRIDATCFERGGDGKGQDYGFRFAGSPTDNMVTGVAEGNLTADVQGTRTGNDIRVMTTSGLVTA